MAFKLLFCLERDIFLANSVKQVVTFSAYVSMLLCIKKPDVENRKKIFLTHV